MENVNGEEQDVVLWMVAGLDDGLVDSLAVEKKWRSCNGLKRCQVVKTCTEKKE